MHSLPKSFANPEVSDQPDTIGAGISAESRSFDSGDAAPRNASATRSSQGAAHSTSAGESPDLLDRYFESTFHRAGVGLAHVDLQGRFLRVNPLFCQILGYSSDQLCQMTFMQVSEPDSVVRDWPALQELINGSRDNYTREKRYIRQDKFRASDCNVERFPGCLQP